MYEDDAGGGSVEPVEAQRFLSKCGRGASELEASGTEVLSDQAR